MRKKFRQNNPYQSKNFFFQPRNKRPINFPAEDEKTINFYSLKNAMEQQRVVMHEGRNVRQAAINHLVTSLEKQKKNILKLENLLAKYQSSQMYAEFFQILLDMKSSYFSDTLALKCELYVNVVENYFLSPEHAEDFSINASINSMIEMFASEGQEKIKIKKSGLLSGRTEYLVKGCKALLLYSLVNLIKNSIKFSKKEDDSPNEIIVSLEKSEKGFFLSVRDNGIGMTEEQMQKCFDVQNKKFNPSIQGNGSGLGNIRNFLLKVQGEISVESVFGKGATFKIDMPLLLLKEIVREVDYTGIRILVVEDESINLIILCKMLERIGFKDSNICRTKNKEIAFQSFEKWDSENRGFQFVLTDLNMPADNDGLILVEKIRKYEKDKKIIKASKIVILSGNQFLKESDNRFELADNFSMKPYIQETLISTLTPYVDEINKDLLVNLLSECFFDLKEKNQIINLIQGYTREEHGMDNFSVPSFQ